MKPMRRGRESFGAFAALAVIAALLTSCAVFQPIGDLSVRRVSTDWTQHLYDLEIFAYEPVELGRPLFVKGDHLPDGGLVVVPSKDRRIRGMKAVDGSEVWSFETEGFNLARPLAVGEDLVVASADGSLYRLHQRNGGKVWKTDFPGQAALISEPVSDGERVFATSIENRLAAFSLEDGKLLWDRKRPHVGEFTITGQAGATLRGEQVITGFSDGRLAAFSRQDGATLWAADLTEGKKEFIDVDTTPVIADDLIVAACYAVGLFGIEADTGKVKWLVRGEGFLEPTEFEGTLYVPQGQGAVWAIDAATGEVRWRMGLEYESARPLAVTRKTVIVPMNEGLLLLDRGTGRAHSLLRDTKGFSAQPEVAWGQVYALSNSGIMYAFSIY